MGTNKTPEQLNFLLNRMARETDRKEQRSKERCAAAIVKILVASLGARKVAMECPQIFAWKKTTDAFYSLVERAKGEDLEARAVSQAY